MSELAADGVPVAVTCRVLNIARQPYCRWRARPVTASKLERAYWANALFGAHRDDPEFGYRSSPTKPARQGGRWRIGPRGGSARRRARGVRSARNAADTARDMDLVRAAMGERKINYLGMSYGTYLGAVYGSLFPSKLNRSVLDSSMHPDWSYYEATKTQAIASKESVDAWSAWIAQRHGTYGLGTTAQEVRAALDKLRAQLERTPVPWDRSTLPGCLTWTVTCWTCSLAPTPRTG